MTKIDEMMPIPTEPSDVLVQDVFKHLQRARDGFAPVVELINNNKESFLQYFGWTDRMLVEISLGSYLHVDVTLTIPGEEDGESYSWVTDQQLRNWLSHLFNNVK